MAISEWLVNQLCDSAFPAGGFAHSGGLEAAWQHQRVSSAESLEAYVRSQLNVAAHASVPFVAGAHQEKGRFIALDILCDAMLSNHVSNRASRAQGQAFFLAASRVFPHAGLRSLLGNDDLRQRQMHLAPVFGLICRKLDIDLETTVRSFLFLALRGLISAGVRLGIVGPMQGQALQWAVTPFAESLVIPASQRCAEDAAHTAPLLELLQGTQDRLYSRLFQS